MFSSERWSPEARRLGIACALAVLVVGILYVAVIVGWLAVERTPSAPIGDPYLAMMEVLTTASGLALVGLAVALTAYTSPRRRVYSLIALAFAVLAAGTTMAVHFVQLTAVRQLWSAGLRPDYRLVWPSVLFAAEYFAWDVLVGLALVSASAALGDDPRAPLVRRVLLAGGCLCLLGVIGPVTGRMLIQNVAVLGYAGVFPVAAGLLARLFLRSPPYQPIARSTEPNEAPE